MCDTTMRGKVRWLSLSGRDFRKNQELKLVLDAQVDKYDVKNNIAWQSRSLVICSDLLMIILFVNISVTKVEVETISGPAFDPASHPAPAPAPFLFSISPVMPSRQISNHGCWTSGLSTETEMLDVVLKTATVGKVFPAIQPLHKIYQVKHSAHILLS